MKIIRFIVLIITFLLLPLEGYAQNTIRVISLAPSITEILYAMDAGDTLVGVTTFCDYPKEAQSIEKIGGYISPNLEKIIALKPDMVILSPNSATRTLKSTLDSLGIPNTVVSFYSISDLLETYKQVGVILKKEDEAHALITRLNAVIDLTKRKTQAVSPKSVLFVRDHNPLFVSGKGTYEDELITIGGGENCIDDNQTRYPRYNIEEVLQRNPDIIIDGTFYEPPTETQLETLRKNWSTYSHLKAVQNNNIFIIQTDAHSVPGPRTALMIEVVAQIIHPEIFNRQSIYVKRLFDDNKENM